MKNCLFIHLLIPAFTFSQQPIVIELNEGWQFTQTGKTNGATPSSGVGSTS